MARRIDITVRRVREGYKVDIYAPESVWKEAAKGGTTVFDSPQTTITIDAADDLPARVLHVERLELATRA